jgi:hypothetical protein
VARLGRWAGDAGYSDRGSGDRHHLSDLVLLRSVGVCGRWHAEGAVTPSIVLGEMALIVVVICIAAVT